MSVIAAASPLLSLAVRQCMASYAHDVGTTPTDLRVMLSALPGKPVVDVKAVRREGVVHYTLPEHPELGAFKLPLWARLEPGTVVDEAVGQNEDGTDVVQRSRLTATRCWELSCACGRKRYGSTNNRDRITACKVCAAQQRRARKTEWQRDRRRQQS